MAVTRMHVSHKLCCAVFLSSLVLSVVAIAENNILPLEYTLYKIDQDLTRVEASILKIDEILENNTLSIEQLNALHSERADLEEEHEALLSRREFFQELQDSPNEVRRRSR